MEREEAGVGSYREGLELDEQDAYPDLGREARVLEFADELAILLDTFGVQVPSLTPLRFARWLDLAANPTNPGPELVLDKVFVEAYDELVIVKDIQFSAICEHHLLPFTGHAAVGYIPTAGVVGLSKLARLVNWATARITMQERATAQIADALYEGIAAKGVMVVLYECVHSCMSTRGVRDTHARTTTSAVRGTFKESDRARAEFLSLLMR